MFNDTLVKYVGKATIKRMEPQKSVCEGEGGDYEASRPRQEG